MVDPEVVLQGGCGVGDTVLSGPVHVLAFAARDFGGGEVQHCYPKTVPVLVVGEALGGDMLVRVERVDGTDGELTQPCRGVEARGEAGEDCGIKGLIEVKVLSYRCDECRGVREPLFPSRDPWG